MFNPNDKTNMAPYRVIHFIIIAFFIIRFMPRDWKGLEAPIMQPAILCGQHSLEVFCIGIFLSFVGHSILIMYPGVLMQIFVSFAGIALLIAVAYFKEWTKKLDKAPPKLADDGTAVRKMGKSILTKPPRAKAAQQPVPA